MTKYELLYDLRLKFFKTIVGKKLFVVTVETVLKGLDV